MTAMGVEPGQKGLRARNSPMCTLSQNGYGAILSSRKTDPALTLVFLVAHQSLLPNAPPPSRTFPHRQHNFFRLCDPLGGMLLRGRGPICQPRHRTEKCRLGSKPRDISNSQPIGIKGFKKKGAMGVEPGQKGLHDRNSPMCTLSQNGYGTILFSRKQSQHSQCSPPSREFPHQQQNFFRLCDPLGGMLLRGRGPICQPRHRTEKCRLGSKPRDISKSQPIGMKRVRK